MPEVAVVGAGPAGSALALLLARQGIRVRLLDRACFPRDKPCGEACGPGVVGFFARQGLALPARANSLDGMRLFSDGVAVEIPFRHLGQSARGFALRRAELDAALLDAACAAGAEIEQPATVVGISPWSGTGRAVHVRRGGTTHTLSVRLVVGAGGLACPVARALGGRRQAGRVAVLRRLAGVPDLDRFGEAHLAGGGFTGLAPLGGGEATVAVVLTRADARRAGGGSERLWRLGVERCGLSARLREATPLGGWLTTGPLGFSAPDVVAGGAVLLGDAAGFVDPFTGDGVALALGGAERLAPILVEALRRGDTGAAALSPWRHAHARAVRPRLAFDRALRALAARPRLVRRALAALAARPGLGERLLAIPADLAPPSSLLAPSFAREAIAGLVESLVAPASP